MEQTHDANDEANKTTSSAVRSSCGRNLCARVRETTKQICAINSKHVSISDEKIRYLIERYFDLEMFSEMTKQNGSRMFESGLHYASEENESDTCQYLLCVDAINFCFWPDHDQVSCTAAAATAKETLRLEYEHISRGLKRAMERDVKSLSAQNLQKMTGERLREMIGWERQLPLEEARVKRLIEIGRGLDEKYEGSALKLIERAEKSAVKLVELVVDAFPGFKDMCLHIGEVREGQFLSNEVWFLKRAQIFVADTWGALKGKGAGEFHDIEELTTFADYRVPVVLREFGVINYDSELLCKTVDEKETLPMGCEMEVEIRSATVQAVERIKDALNAKYAKSVGDECVSICIDWWLWDLGEKRRDDEVWRPHHRTRTTYY